MSFEAHFGQIEPLTPWAASVAFAYRAIQLREKVNQTLQLEIPEQIALASTRTDLNSLAICGLQTFIPTRHDAMEGMLSTSLYVVPLGHRQQR